MNNNTHPCKINSLPVFHAPLIVDVATQKVYRRWGHVSYPKDERGFINKKRIKHKISSKLKYLPYG